MSGVVALVKKWWVSLLVFTLALSLTSCSKKASQVGSANYGYTACDGSMGSFDAYIVPVAGQPGKYELDLVPVQVNAQADIAEIAMVRSDQTDYRVFSTDMHVANDTPILLGTISDTDLDQFDRLVIIPSEPGVTLFETNPQVGSACNLPMPGDSNTNNSGSTSIGQAQ